jgi:RNA polymerase sigma-70 factor, ECF subfamily
MPTQTDADLLRMHADGDRDAFGRLYARHRDKLHRVARRIVANDAEAEDAVQDAMIKAHQHSARFRGESAVSTWLHSIVVNSARDIARRRQLVVEPDETVPSSEPFRTDDNQDIRRACRNVLTRDQMRAILLVDVYGYSLAEASDVLGVPPGTVKSRAARGRARLATWL